LKRKTRCCLRERKTRCRVERFEKYLKINGLKKYLKIIRAEQMSGNKWGCIQGDQKYIGGLKGP